MEVGGLKIDTKARALDENDKSIKNLYAAGEVAGVRISKNAVIGSFFLTFSDLSLILQ